MSREIIFTGRALHPRRNVGHSRRTRIPRSRLSAPDGDALAPRRAPSAALPRGKAPVSREGPPALTETTSIARWTTTG